MQSLRLGGSNGIPCIVTGTHSASMFGKLADCSKINILVPETSVKDAQRLLEVLSVGDNLSLVEIGYNDDE